MSNYPDTFRGLPGEDSDMDPDMQDALDGAFRAHESLIDEVASIGKSLYAIDRAACYGQADAGHEGDLRSLTDRMTDVAATLAVLARDAKAAVR